MVFYLYLKTSPLGLKYLGKTTKNPYKYIGSGKIWLRHIKKHNFSINDINTEILLETINFNELKELGKKLSQEWNIVQSDNFANLIPELGEGGDTSKYINYDNPVFRDSSRANLLNGVNLSDDERKFLFKERSKKINYKNPERMRKIKENTDYKKLVNNRNTDYSKFLDTVHEKNKKAILQFTLNDEFVKEYSSITELSKEIGVKIPKIRSWIKDSEIGLGYKWLHKKTYERNKQD